MSSAISFARADAAKIPVPKLRIAYTHLKAYEKQRQRDIGFERMAE